MGTDTTPASFSHAGDSVLLNGLMDTIAIAFIGSNAASNSGTLRLDDFALAGAVTPVPLAPSVAFFTGGLAFVSPRLKRQPQRHGAS
jgi:hypothetical protein